MSPPAAEVKILMGEDYLKWKMIMLQACLSYLIGGCISCQAVYLQQKAIKDVCLARAPPASVAPAPKPDDVLPVGTNTCCCGTLIASSVSRCTRLA